MLSVHDLEYIRGERLLFTELAFSLHPGEVMQIEGANGSGKTSLMRLVAGLGLPTEGAIRWNGICIRQCREAYCQSTVYLGHGLGIKSDLTPLENLQHALTISGLALPRKDAIRALADTGLDAFMEQPSRTLSAGQNQRIALSRLILHPGTLWILDEPYTALDRQGINMLNQLLERHSAKGGMALVSSHQPVELQVPLRTLQLS